MSIKIALPKGRLLADTAALLQEASWGLNGYHEGARLYRLKPQRFPELLAKIFQEKDIPIQVAIGNYDIGICGLDWIEELLVKYPNSALVKVKNLGYSEDALYMAASRLGAVSTLEEIGAKPDTIRIASEYPNLAESFAVNLRLRRFSVFPLWGAAEVYPPENADLVLIPGYNKESLNNGLIPIGKVLDYSAFLIANRNSWETKDMGDILTSLEKVLPASSKRVPSENMPKAPKIKRKYKYQKTTEDAVRLALPDGHQQIPTLQLLNKAGIQVEDYPSETGNRRPTTNLEGIVIKVIRPQDMPLQVANGNFDLAITGRDWLRDHFYRFPSSPVDEVLVLGFGKVRIVVVVSKDLHVSSTDDLRKMRKDSALRVASEYVNIADKYAHDNHLVPYKLIPTWGASEALLPEDADVLIENTETGSTIAKHNLKIIDTLFESSACLIGNTEAIRRPDKKDKIAYLVETMRRGVEASCVS